MATPNELLRHERQLRGWSQGHLARQIGVPDYYISRWERGEVLPSPYYQQKLCELFDKTAEELGMLLSKDSAAYTRQRATNGTTLDSGPITPLPESIPIALLSKDTLAPASSRRFPLPRVLRRRWEGPRMWRYALLIALISGAALGLVTPLALNRINSRPVAISPIIAGHLYFLSSGQTTDGSNQGIADGVELILQHIAAPAPGKSYYAWLLPDIDRPEDTVVLLGKLSVRAGSARLVYNDPRHMNLLAITSRFLVTEEDATYLPLAPSIDKTTWRFAATISQTPVSGPEGLQYSFLDHLRHLLVDDPKLIQLGLPGGVMIWLYRDVQSILNWSMSARDDWQADPANASAVQQQAIRILEYLDGIPNAQVDAPPGQTLPILVDRRIGSVALLQLTPQQDPPAHLYHVNLHVIGLSVSPHTSSSFHALSLQIIAAIKHVNRWLEQVRQDARQLVAMSGKQVSRQTTQVILTDLVSNANYAFSGRTEAGAGNDQQGVAWIQQSVRSLPSMDIVANPR